MPFVPKWYLELAAGIPPTTPRKGLFFKVLGTCSIRPRYVGGNVPSYCLIGQALYYCRVGFIHNQAPRSMLIIINSNKCITGSLIQASIAACIYFGCCFPPRIYTIVSFIGFMCTASQLISLNMSMTLRGADLTSYFG